MLSTEFSFLCSWARPYHSPLRKILLSLFAWFKKLRLWASKKCAHVLTAYKVVEPALKMRSFQLLSWSFSTETWQFFLGPLWNFCLKLLSNPSTRLVDFPECCLQNFPEIDVPVLGIQIRTRVYEKLPLVDPPPILSDLWLL